VRRASATLPHPPSRTAAAPLVPPAQYPLPVTRATSSWLGMVGSLTCPQKNHNWTAGMGPGNATAIPRPYRYTLPFPPTPSPVGRKGGVGEGLEGRGTAQDQGKLSQHMIGIWVWECPPQYICMRPQVNASLGALDQWAVRPQCAHSALRGSRRLCRWWRSCAAFPLPPSSRTLPGLTDQLLVPPARSGGWKGADVPHVFQGRRPISMVQVVFTGGLCWGCR